MFYYPGVSVLYFMLLLFVLFQKMNDVKEMLYWIHPQTRGYRIEEKVRSRNVSFSNLLATTCLQS